MVASLILGSHAMHDTFAMIAWNAAGISPVAGSALWSESVAAEVIVFVAVGPFLLRHLTPEIAMVVSAVASLVRWGLLAESSNTIVIAAAEPLHGLTFALLHLSCMRVPGDDRTPRTRGTCTSDLRDGRHWPHFSGAYVNLRFAVRAIWYPGFLGDVSNGRWRRCPRSGAFTEHVDQPSPARLSRS